MNTSQSILKAAKKEFGTTSDLREAGYLLPDGSLLDFRRSMTSDNMDQDVDCSDECGELEGHAYDDCCQKYTDDVMENEAYIEHDSIGSLDGVKDIEDFLKKTCSARIVQEGYAGGRSGAIVVEMSPNCEPTQAQLNVLRNADDEGYQEVFFDVYDRASPTGSKVSVRTSPKYVALAIKRAYDTAYRGSPKQVSILNFL